MTRRVDHRQRELFPQGPRTDAEADADSRAMVALADLCSRVNWPSTASEVAAASGMAESTTKAALWRLVSRGAVWYGYRVLPGHDQQVAVYSVERC